MYQSYHTAAPTNRKFDEAYVLLGRRDTQGVLQCIGAFSAELYVMAYAKKSATPFTFSILPAVSFGKFQKWFKRRAGFKNGSVALPAPIHKYRIIPDFLNKLDEMGLELYHTDNVVEVDDVTINVRNAAHKATHLEKTLHYASQWLAFLLAFTAGAEVLILGYHFIWAVALGYIAHKCAKEFMLFEIVEGVLRDIGWMLKWDYVLKGKFSPRKALETSIYMIGIMLAIGAAAEATFMSIVTYPLWPILTNIGFPPLLIEGFTMFLGGAAAITAGLGTWVGLSASIRYYWTFSFYDNTIEPTSELKAAVAAMPFIEEGKNILNQYQHKNLPSHFPTTTQEKLFSFMPTKHGFSINHT